MPQGRELRLFLAEGTSSGPRFYQIENRTIQALRISATRIKDLVSDQWPEFQRLGVYLVHGMSESGDEILYVGKGRRVGMRVQAHPEGLEFEITSLLLFSSKDNSLHDGKAAWLESKLIRDAAAARRVTLANIQNPELPQLGRVDLDTVSEFYEDLLLIAQTAGFDFFSPPRVCAPRPEAQPTRSSGTPPALESPEFVFRQPNRNIAAVGYLSDEGFVVKSGSDAIAIANNNLRGGYLELRERLIRDKVLVPNQTDALKLQFAVDYPFSASSAAGSVIAGGHVAGPRVWRTAGGQTLRDYLSGGDLPAA